MASVLLKHFAAPLTLRASQLSRLAPIFSVPSGSASRCVCTLTAHRLLLSAARVTSVAPAQLDSSLLAQCRSLPCIQPSAGMKTRMSLKRRCVNCFFVRRRGRLYIYCRTHPRHKQRQG